MKSNVSRAAHVACLLAAFTLASASLQAQELPASGVTGFDYFYATSPAGVSQLYASNALRASLPIPIGAAVDAVPSRWAHRRRTLGALETSATVAMRGVFLTPMGSAVGNGALHLVDTRNGTQSALVPTGNPAGYDLCTVPRLKFVFAAEDNGAGQTVLRGFSYATPGALLALNPPSLSLAGSPSAYVQRIGVDSTQFILHVPTSSGIHVVQLSFGGVHMTPITFLSTAPASPTTNPQSFTRGGALTWTIGTSTFNANPTPAPVAAGMFTWTENGAVDASSFGIVPTAPSKQWIPAAGTQELALVSDGSDAYAYYLLREPGPGTFFVKPSAIGVVRFQGSTPPITSTILMPDSVGEPFANPAVSGKRVAFESSFGPPFSSTPPDGGEKISILYSPLDVLGAGSADGVLGVPAPLGGRISTKGMDRPIWSVDGTRVMAATSHFPGAPNPGVPGLEVLNVPANVVLDGFSAPHTVVANNPFPNQSILQAGTFLPRNPAAVISLAGMSFYGTVFNQGLASLATLGFGEVGQIQLDPVGFVQSPFVPNFPAILPPSFLDASGSLTPIPGNFGARRSSFNFDPLFGPDGLMMSAAIGDRIIVEMSSTNMRAAVGIGVSVDNVALPLPAGWVTTTEIASY